MTCKDSQQHSVSIFVYKLARICHELGKKKYADILFFALDSMDSFNMCSLSHKAVGLKVDITHSELYTAIKLLKKLDFIRVNTKRASYMVNPEIAHKIDSNDNKQIAQLKHMYNKRQIG